MNYFLQGLILGLAYVAPIGLQNLFVINAAFRYPRYRALLTACIVIFFDVTLALACFFGIGAVMEHYVWLQLFILLFGSLVVIYIGFSLIRSKITDPSHEPANDSIRKTISSACVVTWCNPQAVIDGTMMLGAFHVTLTAHQSTPFISGVVVASCLWFTGLTVMVSMCSNKIGPRVLRAINLVCGTVIIFYGLTLLCKFVALIWQ